MPSFKVCSGALTDLEQCVRNRAAVKATKKERNFSVNVTLLVDFIDRVGSYFSAVYQPNPVHSSSESPRTKN